MDDQKRGILGWITVILAPLGILGGPLAIASMASHLIEWHGPFGYLIHFWKEEIREPFKNIVEWARTWVHFPKPPDLAVDYAVLSILVTSSYLRATYIVPKNSTWHTIKNGIFYLFFWPVVTMSVILSVAREGVRSWPRLLLTFAPFLGFLALWAANEIGNLTALASSASGH